MFIDANFNLAAVPFGVNADGEAKLKSQEILIYANFPGEDGFTPVFDLIQLGLNDDIIVMSYPSSELKNSVVRMRSMQSYAIWFGDEHHENDVYDD